MNTLKNEGNVKKLLLIGIIILTTCSITFPFDASSYFLGGIFNGGFNIFSLFHSQKDDKTTEKQFNVPMGKTLKMNLNTGGSIKISGWNKDELFAKVIRRGRDDKYCKVDFTQTEEGIEILSEYDGPHKNTFNTDMTYEIKVPKKFNLQLNSMGGAIEIKEVEGSMEGETKGGQISLNNLKGSLHITTMGGAISLTDSDVDGQVSTMGGNVLIDNVKGSVKGTSMGGNVTYTNVTGEMGDNMGDEVNISSMGGDINVDKAPKGAKVSTMGGNIKIGKAKNFVKAKTMGGTITIEEIDGSVNATTMGGEINVKVQGNAASDNHDVRLTTMSGDVILYVPSDFSMDVDINIAMPKGMYDESRVESDFKLDIKEKGSDDNEWHSHSGIEGTRLEAKGSFNGGKNRVEIKAMNGKVYLKKM